MSRAKLVLTIFLATIVPVFAGSHQQAGNAQQNVRLELIPPSPVTGKVTLDIRGAIENQSDRSQQFTVLVYLDRETPGTLLHKETVTVAPGTSAGVYCRHATAGLTGKHRMIFAAKSAGASYHAERTLEVWPSDVRSTRTIDGAWAGIVHWSDDEGKYWNKDIRRLTDADWRQQIDGMHGIGMNIVVVQEVFRNQEYYGRNSIPKTGYRGRAYYPSELFPGRMEMTAHDPLEAILDAADRLNMNVFLGVGMYAWFDFGADSLAWHKRVAQELWKRYGRHPSFYGWYVSEETYGSLIPDRGQAAAAQYRQEITAFFREFQSFCRKLAPEKPVMLAPNAHGVPKAQDVWPVVLKHLDIVCPFAFHRMPPGDLTGEQSAALFQRICDQSGSHLWMDMEAFLFEGQALVPRPIQGLIQDLTRFPNFEKILCYQYPGIFNSPDARIKPGGPPTVTLYRDYDKYLDNLKIHRVSQSGLP